MKRCQAAIGGGLVLVCALSVGAQSPKEFHAPDGVQKLQASQGDGGRYMTPEIYERWWNEIAACEGLPLPEVHRFVRWYAINYPSFYDALSPVFVRDSAGLVRTDSAGHPLVRLAVAISYIGDLETYVALPYLYDEIVIKHEMLHFLLAWSGWKPNLKLKDPYHPPDRFERCGVTTQR